MTPTDAQIDAAERVLCEALEIRLDRYWRATVTAMLIAAEAHEPVKEPAYGGSE